MRNRLLTRIKEYVDIDSTALHVKSKSKPRATHKPYSFCKVLYVTFDYSVPGRVVHSCTVTLRKFCTTGLEFAREAAKRLKRSGGQHRCCMEGVAYRCKVCCSAINTLYPASGPWTSYHRRRVAPPMRGPLLLCLTAMAVTLPPAYAASCDVPPGVDKTLKPRFWCEHSVVLTLDSGCSVGVVETVRTPWWTGSESRSVAVWSQKVEDFKVRQVDISGNDSALMQLEIHDVVPVRSNDRVLKQQKFTWSGAASNLTGEQTWELSYTVAQGVFKSLICGEFDDDSTFSDAQGAMMTMWTPEGDSVSEIRNFNVVFKASNALEAIESKTTRYLFSGAEYQSEYLSDTIVAKFRGEGSHRAENDYDAIVFSRTEPSTNPGGIAFIVWHSKFRKSTKFARSHELTQLQDLETECVAFRNCVAERSLATFFSTPNEEEGGGGKLSKKAVVGISIGITLIAAVAVFAGLGVGSNVKRDNRAAVNGSESRTRVDNTEGDDGGSGTPADAGEDADGAAQHAAPHAGSSDSVIALDVDLEPDSASQSGVAALTRVGVGPPDANADENVTASTSTRSPRNATNNAVSPKDLLRDDFANTMLTDPLSQPKSAKAPKSGKGTRDKVLNDQEKDRDREKENGEEHGGDAPISFGEEALGYEHASRSRMGSPSSRGPGSGRSPKSGASVVSPKDLLRGDFSNTTLMEASLQPKTSKAPTSMKWKQKQKQDKTKTQRDEES